MADVIVLALLGLGVLAYLFVGLMPFTFDFTREVRIHLGFYAPFNSLLNFLCFMPLGMLIAGLSWVERPLLAAGLICATLSLTVESLQLFVPGRFCSISDLLLNTAGGVAGACLLSRLQ